jgi:hypothetical protein
MDMYRCCRYLVHERYRGMYSAADKYGNAHFIGLDQFFDTRHQKIRDWITLAIQSRSIGTGSVLHFNPNNTC